MGAEDPPGGGDAGVGAATAFEVGAKPERILNARPVATGLDLRRVASPPPETAGERPVQGPHRSTVVSGARHPAPATPAFIHASPSTVRPAGLYSAETQPP